ncbi:MAG: hypothetical protein ACK4UN_19435 [Limisphaerales bacterium]
MATSSNGLSFSTPTQILSFNPPGVADFIAPRAVYANTPSGPRWFVYVQGVPFGDTKNRIYAASGPSLTSLAWHPISLIAPDPSNSHTTGDGIGEEFQVFNFTN